MLGKTNGFMRCRKGYRSNKWNICIYVLNFSYFLNAALLRWGVVLQQRSRLRPRNSKEKVKLLMQAKRLYEDALDMDSNNLQVREALYSCVAELNRRLL